MNEQEKKYKDKSFLYEQYVVKKKLVSEIAKMCNCSKTTIQRHIKKHGFFYFFTHH